MTSNEISISSIGSSLQRVRTADDLRRLLNYPAWGFITQLLNRTRAYDSALTGTELLIEIIKSYEAELKDKELNNFLQSTYTLKLQMLDKLDLWNEYLVFWQELRESTDYEICYASKESDFLPLPASDPKDLHEKSLKKEDFVLRIESGSIYVHWLYLFSSRYNLIQKKLERKNSGKSRKSDLHHSQLDLSEIEIRRRLVEFERIVSLLWGEKNEI